MNLFIPQWQGSGEKNDLFFGAHALKAFIEKNGKSLFENVYVNETENSEMKNNIAGYEIIKDQLMELEKLLNQKKPKKIFTIGGGCDIEIPIVSYLNHNYENLKIFWFDAHGDLNSPQSSYSKLFHGMPLRFLTDPRINLSDIEIHKIAVQNINLLGTRDLDPAEKQYIKENRIKTISIEEMRNLDQFKTVIKMKKENVYIHIDLDVLDPQYYKNVKCPTDSGLSMDELLEAIKAIKAIKENSAMVGFSIVENTETDPENIRKLNDLIEIGLTL